MERFHGPGLGSSCSSFGNGTKPYRKKSLQRSAVQLVPVEDPEERPVSMSSSTHTCTEIGLQKSKEGSVALDLLNTLSALPGVNSAGIDCHSAVADFNKSPANEMQVSIAGVVGSNKINDLRRSSSFNISDAVAISNKSSSDLCCFTTGALYASSKKRSAQPAGPSIAADSDDDGFSGVFVPVSRVHF